MIRQLVLIQSFGGLIPSSPARTHLPVVEDEVAVSLGIIISDQLIFRAKYKCYKVVNMLRGYS